MKKRNKYYTKEKEFIRLNKELDKNYQAQKDLGWIELDIPIFIGYEAYLEPREDIQNREDAWVFWEICQGLGTKTFAKKIKYFDWERSGIILLSSHALQSVDLLSAGINQLQTPYS